MSLPSILPSLISSHLGVTRHWFRLEFTYFKSRVKPFSVSHEARVVLIVGGTENNNQLVSSLHAAGFRSTTRYRKLCSLPIRGSLTSGHFRGSSALLHFHGGLAGDVCTALSAGGSLALSVQKYRWGIPHPCCTLKQDAHEVLT